MIDNFNNMISMNINIINYIYILKVEISVEIQQFKLNQWTEIYINDFKSLSAIKH